MPTLEPILEEPTGCASPPSMTSLVGGIVADVQQLLEQQLALYRQELHQDLQKTWQAMWLLAIGIGNALLAGVGLLFAIAHYVSWTFPSIPLWTSLGFLGLVLALLAGAMIYHGLKEFDLLKFRLSGSAEALKEHT